MTESPSKSIQIDFSDTQIDLKFGKKIDLNRYKIDLSEIRMDFSESDNPSKSI